MALSVLEDVGWRDLRPQALVTLFSHALSLFLSTSMFLFLSLNDTIYLYFFQRPCFCLNDNLSLYFFQSRCFCVNDNLSLHFFQRRCLSLFISSSIVFLFIYLNDYDLFLYLLQCLSSASLIPSKFIYLFTQLPILFTSLFTFEPNFSVCNCPISLANVLHFFVCLYVHSPGHFKLLFKNRFSLSLFLFLSLSLS